MTFFWVNRHFLMYTWNYAFGAREMEWRQKWHGRINKTLTCLAVSTTSFMNLKMRSRQQRYRFLWFHTEVVALDQKWEHVLHVLSQHTVEWSSQPSLSWIIGEMFYQHSRYFFLNDILFDTPQLLGVSSFFGHGLTTCLTHLKSYRKLVKILCFLALNLLIMTCNILERGRKVFFFQLFACMCNVQMNAYGCLIWPGYGRESWRCKQWAHSGRWGRSEVSGWWGVQPHAQRGGAFVLQAEKIWAACHDYGWFQ